MPARASLTELVVPAPDLSRKGKRGIKPAGSINLGSEEHLRLFCRELLETHDPYKPAVIDWPALDADALGRLTSLPLILRPRRLGSGSTP